jgi:hypothetical protein
MYVLIVGSDHVRTGFIAGFMKTALPGLEVECCHFVHHFEWIKERRIKPRLIISDHTCSMRRPELPDYPMRVKFADPKAFARNKKIPFIRYSRFGAAGPLFRAKLALFAFSYRMKKSRKSA